MDGSPDLAATLFEQAEILTGTGAFTEALERAEKARTLFESHVGADHPDTANTWRLISLLRIEQGAFDGAVTAAQCAAESLDVAAAQYPDEPIVARFRAEAYATWATALGKTGRYEPGAALVRSALEFTREGLGPDALELASLYNALGMMCKYLARFEESASSYASALHLMRQHGLPEEEFASLYHNLGGLAHCRGAFAEAEPHARRALELRTKLHGEDHPAVAADIAGLAPIVDALGRAEEAIALYERALSLFAKHLGSEHHEIAFNTAQLATLHATRGRNDEAATLFEHALALQQRLNGREHVETATTAQQLAVVRYRQGRLQEAKALCEGAEQALQQNFGPGHPRVLDCVATSRAIEAALGP